MKYIVIFLSVVLIASIAGVEGQEPEFRDFDDLHSVSAQTREFLNEFLLKRDEKKVGGFLTETQFSCSNTSEDDLDFDTKVKLLRGIQKLSEHFDIIKLDRSKLSTAVKSSDLVNFPEITRLTHANESIFSLYLVNKPGQICGNPKMDLNDSCLSGKDVYLAAFKLVNDEIAFTVVWVEVAGVWKVVSFGVETP